MNYIDAKSGSHSLNIAFRHPIPGLESQLVEAFIHSGLPNPKPDQQCTVLVEPSTGVSYPDILVIYWTTDKLEKYMQHRKKLSKKEIKVFHYVLNNPGVNYDDVALLFGDKSKAALNTLLSVKIMYSRGGKFFIYKKYGEGVIDRLIVIEAKVSDWRKGIRQASSLGWITDERYLLIKDRCNRDKIIDTASQYGIGVLFSGESISESNSICSKPYGYWYVNEEILLYKGLIEA